MRLLYFYPDAPWSYMRSLGCVQAVSGPSSKVGVRFACSVASAAASLASLSASRWSQARLCESTGSWEEAAGDSAGVSVCHYC